MITVSYQGYKRTNFKQNKKYKVEILEDDMLCIIGEVDIEDFSEKDDRRFKKYFYTLKQLRKYKLDYLENNL